MFFAGRLPNVYCIDGHWPLPEIHPLNKRNLAGMVCLHSDLVQSVPLLPIQGGQMHDSPTSFTCRYILVRHSCDTALLLILFPTNDNDTYKAWPYSGNDLRVRHGLRVSPLPWLISSHHYCEVRAKSKVCSGGVMGLLRGCTQQRSIRWRPGLPGLPSPAAPTCCSALVS